MIQQHLVMTSWCQTLLLPNIKNEYHSINNFICHTWKMVYSKNVEQSFPHIDKLIVLWWINLVLIMLRDQKKNTLQNIKYQVCWLFKIKYRALLHSPDDWVAAIGPVCLPFLCITNAYIRYRHQKWICYHGFQIINSNC